MPAERRQKSKNRIRHFAPAYLPLSPHRSHFISIFICLYINYRCWGAVGASITRVLHTGGHPAHRSAARKETSCDRCP
ncbi:hypothetical protein CBM2626_B60052 [Cupriavidus taiwanensis]|nr:hypothetical protein CBM2626_B60052 [Cupriavidus taiwanensis]